MARLGDGHSTIYFFFGPRSLRQIPIRFYDFCDGLYVTSAPAGLERLIGARVAAIGSLAPEVALARVAPYVSKDNPMFIRAMGSSLLAFPDFLHAIGAVADPRHIPLTVLGPGGRRETVDLDPQPGGAIAKHKPVGPAGRPLLDRAGHPGAALREGLFRQSGSRAGDRPRDPETVDCQ